MARLTLPTPDQPIAACPRCGTATKINQHWYQPLQRMVDAGNDASLADRVTALEESLAANAQTVIAEGTLSGANIDITDIPQTFSQLLLAITGMSFNAPSTTPFLRPSTDNGASFDATAGNYIFFTWASVLATASLLAPLTLTNAVDTATHMLVIEGYREGAYPMAFGSYVSGGIGQPTWGTWFGSTDAVNALRIGCDNGFDAGAYKLIGVK